MTVSAPPAASLSRTAASFRSLGLGGRDPAARAVTALEDDWRRGTVPSLERLWFDHGGTDESLSVLAALVKADIRCRFARGERPEVAVYLDRFPGLREVHDRVVSLVYEEYCLREEHGEALDVDRFCDRYDAWRDSLQSQLRYHRLLSQVIAPPSAPPRFPEPGEVFQGFRLLKVLGRGGVARVYLANELAFGGREVALKVSPDRGKEASIQGRLDHPHIVPVWSVTAKDPVTGLHGLCMRYRAGLSLDEVIRVVEPASRPRRAAALWQALADKSPDPEADGEGERRNGWQSFPARGTYAQGVAWIILTLAKALHHAHAHGVLHRDVKPANVLLTDSGGPQLLDFNLAHEPHAAEHAEAALRGGTLPYMAPEQLEAFLDPTRWEAVGEAADLYSLGLLLAELLTGRRPDPPDPSLPLPRAIRELLDRRAAGPGSVRDENPTIPHALAAIAARCLAFSPSDRYPNALALAEDLERFLSYRTPRHVPNPSRVERGRNWLRRNRVALAAVGVIALSIPLSTSLLREGAGAAPRYVQAGRDSVAVNQLDEAREAFEHALRLNPRSWSAYWGLAAVANREKRWDRVYQCLTRAIELARADGSKVPPNHLAQLYQERAGASLEWGKSYQQREHPDFVAAAPHYAAAGPDLDRARKLNVDSDHELEFRIDYSAAYAEMFLGDVASSRDDYEESCSRFGNARNLIERALQEKPGDAYALGVQREVDRRLQVDIPQREMARRAAPPDRSQAAAHTTP